MNTNNHERRNSNGIMNIIMIVIATITVVFVTYKYVKRSGKKTVTNQHVMKKQKWTHNDSVAWAEAVKKAHEENMAQKKRNVAGAPSNMAVQMAQRFAKERMDFPETVSFEGDAKCVINANGYIVNQELVERSGDGTFIKFKYRVTLIFLGGDNKDAKNWTYNELSITNENTGREIIFSSPGEWS
jgi:hypothetical protein